MGQPWRARERDGSSRCQTVFRGWVAENGFDRQAVKYAMRSNTASGQIYQAVKYAKRSNTPSGQICQSVKYAKQRCAAAVQIVWTLGTNLAWMVGRSLGDGPRVMCVCVCVSRCVFVCVCVERERERERERRAWPGAFCAPGAQNYN